MASAFAFWQLINDEEVELLAQMSKLGELYAFRGGWHQTSTSVEAQPIVDCLDQEKLLLVPRQLLHSISIESERIDGAERFGVTTMRACVIAYRRGRPQGSKLPLSHLSAYWERLSEDRAGVVAKLPEFVDWGKKVLATARRFAPVKVKTYRATKAAQSAALRGEVELVDY